MAAEGRDLALLAACAAAVPAVWLALGWTPGLAAYSHDGLLISVPHLKALMAAGGDWRAAAYRADWLGGVKLNGVAGSLPFLDLLARLGVGVHFALNALVFLTQALYAFLGLRTAADLGARWAQPGVPRPAVRFALFLLLAFAPVLGWQLGSGHQTQVAGCFSLISVWALLAAAADGSLTVTLALAAGTGIAHGLPWAGVQTFVCGALFGAPLLAEGFWNAAGARPRSALLAWLAAACAAVLVFPRFEAMLAHATGSDAARGLGSSPVVFSYAVSTARDWLTSIPWAREWPAAYGRPLKFQLETNIPWGPLLLLLAAVPRPGRAAAWAWALGAAAAVLFSMDAWPVSGALLSLFPPLGNFRAPQRSALPLALALPILAGAVVLAGAKNEKTPSPRAAALGTGLCAAAFWGAPWLREPLGWLAAAALLRPAWAARAGLSRDALLLALGLCGLAAFRERLPLLRDLPAALDGAAREGARIRAEHPELGHPLSRVRVEPPILEFGNNTAFMMGLSSMDGYFFPPKRFLELTAALAGKPYNPLVDNFSFGADSPAFPVLARLYNVGFLIRRGEGGHSVEKLDGGAPAWFAGKARKVKGFKELAEVLRSNDFRRPFGALVIASDPKLPAGFPENFSKACARARVRSLAALPDGTVLAGVDSPALCALVISMNYAENLRAVREADRSEPLTVFPAYGALAGVLVPPGKALIKVQAF